MDSPSARLVAEANAALSVTDSEGRFIEMRQLTALDRLRLFRAVGPMVTNDRYLGMAMLACAVTAVDGVPMPFPASEQAIEAAVHRLGDAGLDAVGKTLHPAPDAHPDFNPGN